MQNVIAALRARQAERAIHAPPSLEDRRAGFTPGARLHKVSDDVVIEEVSAGGVPARSIRDHRAPMGGGTPSWRQMPRTVGSLISLWRGTVVRWPRIVPAHRASSTRTRC